MQDSLQRIKELTVKASNGIYTDEDRQMIQMEIVLMIWIKNEYKDIPDAVLSCDKAAFGVCCSVTNTIL